MRRALFAVEYARAPTEFEAFLAGDLGDRALRCHVPVEDNQMAVFLERVGQRPHNGLSSKIHTCICKIFRLALARDGERLTVQQASLEQHFHQRLDAADGDELGHQVAAAGTQIRKDRHPFADACEVIE